MLRKFFFQLREGKCDGILLMVEFEKTFQNLHWDFLLSGLRAKGFSFIWIVRISAILKSFKASYLVNVVQGNHFKINKGLKQDCPLCSILFILTIDGFDNVIRKVVSNGYLSGLGHLSYSWLFFNFHFADYALIFCNKFKFELVCLKLILFNFELALG